MSRLPVDKGSNSGPERAVNQPLEAMPWKSNGDSRLQDVWVSFKAFEILILFWKDIILSVNIYFKRQHDQKWCGFLWLCLHLPERVDRSRLLRPRHHPDQRDLRPRHQLHRPVFRYWGVTLPKWKLHRGPCGLPAESWVRRRRRRPWNEEETHFIQTLLATQMVHTSMSGSLPQSLLLSSDMSLQEETIMQLAELLHRWKSWTLIKRYWKSVHSWCASSIYTLWNTWHLIFWQFDNLIDILVDLGRSWLVWGDLDISGEISTDLSRSRQIWSDLDRSVQITTFWDFDS